jgi:GPH family glycoside/pentoside/hexuronide:cation symporter
MSTAAAAPAAPATHKLSFGEKLGYGFGDLASVLFWQTLTAYLLYFYTDVFGIAAASAGTMIMVTRILDGLFDPVMGMIGDRTKTRWGKYRPYLLWMAVPLAVAAVLTFWTPPLGPGGKLAYAYVTLILFMFLYSAINIPYSSLLGVISADPAERTSASSFKFTGAYVAGAVVSATALPLTRHLGGGDEAKGWPLTMALYGVLAVVFFLITFVATKERVQPQQATASSVSQDLGDLSRNVPWMIMLGTSILMILFVAIRISVATHYFKYFVGTQTLSLPLVGGSYDFVALASAFNTVGQVCSILGVMLVPAFARRVGKKSAFIALFVVAVLSNAAFWLLRPQDVALMFVLQIVGTLVAGPLSSVIWAMYADTADYSEWRTGRRATGLIFSATILSQKVGWAVGIAFAGYLLSAFGFHANVEQNADVLGGLRAMMSVIPALAGLAAIALMLFYPLGEAKVKAIAAELEARRAGTR